MLNTEELGSSRVPQHVAIIMNGNGRWVKLRGQERSYGHQAGVETVYITAEGTPKLGIKYPTLYTFSTGNWNRPSNEVITLMVLLLDSIEEEAFMKNNISFRVIGDSTKLPDNARECLETCAAHTASNTGMSLVLAISYPSHWEITEVVRQIAILVQKGELAPDRIDNHLFSQHLTINLISDPGLLICTGGEIRLSNYLLWQCAYSESYSYDTYWPDFREEVFHKAIYDYQRRERRFGKTGE